MTLQEAGQLILIFDGFDEMDLVGEASLRLDHFFALWAYSRDRGSKVMITGRPNFFLDQIEREASLNIRPPSGEVPYTVPIYLSSFSSDQIAKALRSFNDSVQAEIPALLSDDHTPESFKDLIGRPSTLFLAANIWEEIRPTNAGAARLRSAEVIEKFLRHSYERQEAKLGVATFLSAVEREYFMSGIAIGMFLQTQFSNHILSDRLLPLVAKLLDAFPEELSKFETSVARKKIALRERLHDKEMLLDTVLKDVISCGILVVDLSKPDSFKFAHKSFLEYLIAANVAYHVIKFRLSKNRSFLEGPRKLL